MRCRSRVERPESPRTAPADAGSVTAEFAVALPAVVLVLACCLSGVQVASQQLRLQDAAASAARAAARGGDPGSASRLAPGAGITRYSDGDLVCVRLTTVSTALVGTVMGLTLSATSCALGGGK